MKNKDGQFVEPSAGGDHRRRRRREVPATSVSTIDAPGAETYPITTATFLLVWQDQCKAGIRARQREGRQDLARLRVGRRADGRPELQYAPLPTTINAEGAGQGRRLQCNGTADRTAEREHAMEAGA